MLGLGAVVARREDLRFARKPANNRIKLSVRLVTRMIAHLRLPAVVGFFIATACASHMPTGSLDIDSRTAALPGVTVSFDHFGQAINLGQTKLLSEPDSTDAFTLPGDDIWLKLANASKQVITCLTESQYLRPMGEWDVMLDGTKSPSLRDGAEILVVFSVVDARGHQVPYGTDFHFGSRLKPGTAVFFSVPRQVLVKGRSIYIDFGVEDPATGKATDRTYRIGFSEADLPAKPQ
jgi:hypothetical protein